MTGFGEISPNGQPKAVTANFVWASKPKFQGKRRKLGIFAELKVTKLYGEIL